MAGITVQFDKRRRVDAGEAARRSVAGNLSGQADAASLADHLAQLGFLRPRLAACLPRFLVVSPPKTGSSWLATNLSRHSGIFVPDRKEVDYFSSFFRWVNLNWYLDWFRDKGDRLAGEASPSYSILPVRRIRLIRALMPEVKLIYLMRDPVHRAWSHARHSYRYREANFANCTAEIDTVPESMWQENFTHPWTLCNGDYLGQLKRWTWVFPRDQMYIGFYETIARDPQRLLEGIFDFLGVEQPADFSFPVSQMILPGVKKELPPSLLSFLRDLFRWRTEELAAFLEDELNLVPPEEWRNTLERSFSASAPGTGPHLPHPSLRIEGIRGEQNRPGAAPHIPDREFSDDELDLLLGKYAQCPVLQYDMDPQPGRVDAPESGTDAPEAPRGVRGDLAGQGDAGSGTCRSTSPDRYDDPGFFPMTGLDNVGIPDKTSPAEPASPARLASRKAHRPPARIEYADWLPVYYKFGNCDSPFTSDQIDFPPNGYEFERSNRSIDEVTGGSKWKRRLLSAARRMKVRSAMLRLYGRCRLNGVPHAETVEFLRTRDFESQLLLPRRRNLVFLPSVPFTYGQHPWVLEIEDVISLFFPFVHNGQTADLDIAGTPCFAAVRTLLESERCRAIVTHIKPTAEAIPRLFGSDKVTGKTVHIPMGLRLPPEGQRHEESETINLLFTNPWHQGPNQFYVRGGLDVLEAFATVRERYSQLRLILGTRLPESLAPRYREIVSGPNVKVIDGFLPENELDSLRRSCHIYLLPSARIHTVSVLQAMSAGLVPVVSDGWGMTDYVEHDRTGMVLKGRYGKASWSDQRTGMLREDYGAMYESDPYVVRQLVGAVSALAEDRALRRRLGTSARDAIRTRCNLSSWNLALKQVFDMALSRS